MFQGLGNEDDMEMSFVGVNAPTTPLVPLSSVLKPSTEPFSDALVNEDSSPTTIKLQEQQQQQSLSASFAAAIDLSNWKEVRPWQQQYDEKRPHVNDKLFRFIPWSTYIREKLLHAFRIAFVAILPATLLAYHPSTRGKWADPRTLPSYALIVSVIGVSFGRIASVAYEICKSLVMFLAVSEVIVQINPARNWVAWGFVFFFCSLFIATFTAGAVTKIGLLNFSIFMVTHYLHAADEMSPLYLCRDILVGTAFGMCSALIPFPLTEMSICRKRLKTACMTTSLCLQATLNSVWSTSNTARMSASVRIHTLRSAIHDELENIRAATPLLTFEPYTQRDIDELLSRTALVEEMVLCLDGLSRFLKDVIKYQDIFDRSPRFQTLGQELAPAIRVMSAAIDEFLSVLSDPTQPITEAHIARLQQGKVAMDYYYKLANYRATKLDSSWLHEADPYKSFPFVKVGYFFFRVGNFYETAVQYSPVPKRSCPKCCIPVYRWPLDFFVSMYIETRDLLLLKEDAVGRLVDGMKTSVCMTGSVALFLQAKSPDPVAGTASIGFVSSGNTSSSLLSGLDFFLGVMIGCLVGYVANSVSNELHQGIIWVVTLIFVTGVLRNSRQFGQMTFFMQYFLMQVIIPGGTDKLILTILQQNVVAQTAYFLFINVILPIRPSDTLQQEIRSSITLIAAMYDGKLRVLKEVLDKGSDRTDEDLTRLQQQNEKLTAAREMVTRQKGLLEIATTEPVLHRGTFPAAAYGKVVEHLTAIVNTIHSSDLATTHALALSGNDVHVTVLQSMSPVLLQLAAACDDLFDNLAKSVHNTHRGSFSQVLIEKHDAVRSLVKFELIPRVEAAYVELIIQQTVLEEKGEVTPLNKLDRTRLPSVLAVAFVLRALDQSLLDLVMSVLEIRRIDVQQLM